MNTIKTVSVITTNEDEIESVISFPDTPEGNKEAEKEFTNRAKKIGANADDMDEYLENGRFSSLKTVLTISIVHTPF